LYDALHQQHDVLRSDSRVLLRVSCVRACVSREGGGTVTPLVLVSTAHVSLVDDTQYIQGAGDDEESWAMGLTPALFWDHHDHILEYASQDIVEERIREVVARYKQRRTQALAELTTGGEGTAQQLHWIGQTGIAVADDVHTLVRPEVNLLVDAFEPHKPRTNLPTPMARLEQVWKQFGLVINCADANPQGHAGQLQQSDTTYLHVPLPVRDAECHTTRHTTNFD
jgi:hypothetical protein